MASGSKYKSDSTVWSELVKRTWKKYPNIKIFEEGYDKDYIYERGRDIPIIDLNQEERNSDSNFKLETDRDNMKKYTGGPNIILLTMRGAIKFNMWKRSVFIKNFEYYFFFFHFN